MADRSLASTRVIAQIQSSVRNTMFDGTIVSGSLIANTSESLDNGIGVNQANRGWQWREKELGNGAFVIIDLFDYVVQDMGGGLGMDFEGQALTIDEVVVIKVKNENDTGTDGLLVVQPDMVGGWTPIGIHTVATGGALPAGGVLMKYNPADPAFEITDGVSHRIRLSAFGGDITYSVWVLGRHDDEESSSWSSESSSVSSTSSSSISSSVSSISISTSSVSSVSSSSESSASSESSSSTSFSSVSSPSSSVSSSSSSSLSSVSTSSSSPSSSSWSS